LDVSSTLTASPSDLRQRPLRQLTATVDDSKENEQLSSSKLINVSSSSAQVDVAELVSTASPVVVTRRDNNRVYPAAGTERHEANPDNVTAVAGNGSEAMTSYRVARDTREAAVTDYDMTTTATADAADNRSYVAKLYRSWDDSFLPEVTTGALHTFQGGSKNGTIF